MGVAAFVLLIGALNVANLVSVRATAQVRELVTRLALGATLGTLTRQILTEALLLTAAGGGLGLGLGWWALRTAPLLGLDALPRGAEIGLDGQVAVYTFALVAVVGRSSRCCRCCGCGTLTSPERFVKKVVPAPPRTAPLRFAGCWWPGRWRSR